MPKVERSNWAKNQLRNTARRTSSDRIGHRNPVKTLIGSNETLADNRALGHFPSTKTLFNTEARFSAQCSSIILKDSLLQQSRPATLFTLRLRATPRTSFPVNNSVCSPALHLERDENRSLPNRHDVHPAQLGCHVGMAFSRQRTIGPDGPSCFNQRKS